jgi:acylglycerol lipase
MATSLGRMRTTESTFPAAGGVVLHTVVWAPDADPIADVVLIHGLGEHSGRYEPVAELLTAAGLQVSALDLRGHGRSTTGERGGIDDFDLMVDDAAAFVASVRAARPTFVYGHSMGGLVAIRLAERSQAGIAGFIVTSPALMPSDSVPKILVKVANVLGKVAPRLPTIALEGDAISRVQSVRHDYDTDPLNYRGKLRAGTGRQMNITMTKALAEAARVTEPILIFHGDADRLASVGGSRRLAELVSSKDKTLRIWPGAYHELHHEPERLEVLQAIIDWITAHIQG